MIGRLLARLPRGLRAIAWLGILVGIAAMWVALPPLKVREPIVPILIVTFWLQKHLVRGMTFGAVR